MKKFPLLACLVLLGLPFPMLAEQALPAIPANDDAQGDDRSRLQNQLGKAEHQRLRGELNEYARKVFPDQEQIEGRRRMMQERFRTMDGFGAITRSEAQLRMPRLSRHFDEIDVNGDGVITRDEMEAARKKEKDEREKDAVLKGDARQASASVKGDDRQP